MHRTTPATPSRILNAAAEHIGRVGLYQGEEQWLPGAMGDKAPCTALHAWNQGIRASRPPLAACGELWDVLQCSITDSLIVVTDFVSGFPVPSFSWRDLRMEELAYRRALLWGWSDEPGRTTAEVADVFRTAAAVCASERDHIGKA